jgi:NitT/TauT family transport system ATP-binding protein
MTAPSSLVFDRVSIAFGAPGGRTTALDDVSLTVERGELVAVIGPSGCGKTTLLKVAAGLLSPSAGRATLDGVPITGPGPERGVIFQEYGVFPWLTVAQNIGFGLELAVNRASAAERREIVERYLALMGLGDFRDAYPKTLSGGMRQRVALARAYAVRPGVLLMDEPFGALDAQTRLAMQDLLLEVLAREGTSGLLITHSVEEALYLASRVVVISARPGRIKAVVDSPFPYPRVHAHLAGPEFARLKGELTELVMAEYAAQFRLSPPSGALPALNGASS